VVSETNELNNKRSVTVLIGPDLVVTALSAPTAAAAGSTIIVSETTSNTGAGAAPASATRFFLSKDVFVDPLDIPLEARAIGILNPGQTSSGVTTLTIPADTVTGTYNLFAKADAPGAIAEANETNNTRLASIKIGPDLTVSALTAPLRAGSGATIVVTDTTRNAGSGGAPPSTTAFYLSTNFMLDAADQRLPIVREVPLLGTGEAHTQNTTITLPSIAPGTWFLIANADDPKSVPETLETNNTRYAIVQIGPDLTFAAVGSPSSAVAGGTINVTATVRNSGGAPAGASVVHFYLSTNSTFDAADRRLNVVREVPALAVDGTSSATTIVPLPADRSGTFYLLVVADGAQAVAEYSEGNNVAARLLQISPGS
jgi:subtilase family serine protease